MTASFGRLVAMVRVELALRLRRTSTVIALLLLTALAWSVVPDPLSGRALLKSENQRVLYTTTTIAVGTGSLAALFIGLFGFYAVSNGVSRDLRTRCGFIIASTPISTMSYMFGKFVSGAAFLSVFSALFGVVALVMVAVRGEAAVEPLVFASIYLLLLAPVVSFTAAAALLFESVRFLSGRFGDLAYFFLFLMLMGGVAAVSHTESPPMLARALDFTGIAFVMESLRASLGTSSFSVGASPFDPALAPIALDRLQIAPAAVGGRILGTLLPLVLLVVARFSFHRFDPAVVRSVDRSDSRLRRLIGWLLRPFAAAASRIPSISGPGIPAAGWNEARMTLVSRPWLTAVVSGTAILALMLPSATVGARLLPLLIVIFALAIADLPTRDHQSGTRSMLASMPLLRERHVRWKLTTALILLAATFAVPMTRLAVESMFHLLAGLSFIIALSLFCGELVRNPKLFVVTFLTFVYIAINEAGRNGSWDFAGIAGTADARSAARYTAAAILLLAISAAIEHLRIRRV